MNHLIMMIQQYGAGFVFLNVLALQAGVPVPAYPTLIVAGAYAAMGGRPLWQLVAVGIVASLVADTGWYLAGRKFGVRILGTLCRVSLSPDSCVSQTESIFQRFGATSMLFAKFVPGFASVATAMAGDIFRDAINDVMATLSALGQYGLMLIIAAFAVWIAVKWWRRRMFVKQLRMDRVSVDELRTLIDESKVNAIVDVRSPLMQASTGRIPGARTIDMQKITESFKGVPVDGEVIVYCACPNEATAVKVAQMLRKVGYKRIRPLYGGIDAWIEAGNAVEH